MSTDTEPTAPFATSGPTHSMKLQWCRGPSTSLRKSWTVVVDSTSPTHQPAAHRAQPSDSQSPTPTASVASHHVASSAPQATSASPQQVAAAVVCVPASSASAVVVAAPGRTHASNPPTPSMAVVHSASEPTTSSSSSGASPAGVHGAWYDPKLTELKMVAPVVHHHPVAEIAAHKAVTVGDEVDTDPSLFTVGPQSAQHKSWGVQLPDSVIGLIPICDVEEERERRRKHPDAPLHSTRSRFVRDIGLQEDADDGTTLVDPDTGRSLLLGLDDSKRSYYGYPEDAAWIAFFAGAGRPLEDYGWLKTQVFVDDETVALVDAKLTEDSGAAATAMRANTSNSHDVTTAIILAKWSVASASTSPLRQSMTARDAMMSTYRLSCSKQKGVPEMTTPAPILYIEGGASPATASRGQLTRSGHEGADDAAANPVVELFPQQQQDNIVVTSDVNTTTYSSALLSSSPPRLSVDAVQQVALSSTSSSAASPPGPSPLGSYDKRRIAQLTSSNSEGHGDDSALEMHPSAYVSLPITDRYRPTPSSSTSSAVIAAMPPIKSGREYRNQLRSKFLERKEMGVIAPATIMPRAPHPPTGTDGASTPSREAAPRDLSLLISPAARAILESADPVPEPHV